MKAIREQILEILELYIQISMDRIHIQKKKCASEIESLIKENYVEKEFMEWVSTEGYEFYPRFNTWIYKNRIAAVTKTIDDLHDYWLKEIKK